METISAKLNAHRNLPLGTGLWPSRFLSREERTALEEAVQPSRMVGAHSDLVGERERADSLFLIKEGWAARYVITRRGARQFLGLLVPGDLCNLESLLFDRLDYGVRTLTQATIVALPRDRALALTTQHPGIARMFIWRALVDNAILGKWTLALGRRSAKGRLAHLLCELSARLDVGGGNESRFAFPLTQEQIADTLGLTSVHVNRTIRLLREEGLVAIANQNMTITDVARLRQIGGFDPSYLHIERAEVETTTRVDTPQSSASRNG
ncbi:Crp/Fnr family transcriptional regulator [Sphingomonas koreensis]|nr:Crp/Fnr family transcriptional regulator [Sphingomonas koreensis]